MKPRTLSGRQARRACLAVWLVTALVTSGASAALAWQDPVDDLARVRAEVATIRELRFTVDPDPVVLSRPALRARLVETFRVEAERTNFATEARAFRTFGLYPDNLPIAPLLIESSTVSLVGLYLPDTDELILVGDDDAQLGGLEEWTYAHELVHALQDQQLGLDQLFNARRVENDDVALALGALIEGDASLVTTIYLESHPEVLPGLIIGSLGTLPGALRIGGVPPVLAHTGAFTYAAGERFVERLKEEGGWEAVNAAYVDPPVSTEQILHPEKYLERDDPTPVTLPDLAPAFDEAWNLIHENALGELQIGVLLDDQAVGEFAPVSATASDATAGWDGDTYQLWVDERGHEALVWRSVWDTTTDANEFATAIRDREAERYGTTWEAIGHGSGALNAADVSLRVKRAGDRVIYILAPEAEIADALLDRLGGA